MDLHERIIAYVEKHYPCSMTVLEGIVLSKGFTLEQFYAALEVVHKDKRIVQSVRRGEVHYSPYIAPPVVPPPSHTEWIKYNYPRPHQCSHGVWYTTCEHCMPFPEISYAGLFLKTKEERDAFRAEMTGRPVYMLKSRHDRTNKR